jgi:hypothetical protein
MVEKKIMPEKWYHTEIPTVVGGGVQVTEKN